jgi:SPP1 family predicted phage head-tail adaptor
MRYRSLTVETAPAVEPVTLTEAKQHLRVDIDDDDTYIEALIVAARQYAEEYLDRALISQQLAVRMDTFPYEFELPRPPMATSGTLTTTAVTYALDPGSASTAVPTTTTLSTSQLPRRSRRHARTHSHGLQRHLAKPPKRSKRSDRHVVGRLRLAAPSDVPQAIRNAILMIVGSPLREPPGGCRYRCCSAGCSVWRKGVAQHGQVGIVPMILPGQLRERVTVEQPGRTTTTLGESQITWSTFATRWASVEGVSSREALQYGQQQIEITHKVRMRYLEGLTHEMRLQWRSRTLDVVSVLEYANRSEHVLICQEQVA